MNKAVFFLAALGASTALCASIPAENAEKTVSGTSVRKTAWKEPRQTAASASTAGSVQGIRLLLYFVIILYYREKK